MDFDPVCVDDCRTVVCRAQDRGDESTGFARQLDDRGWGRTDLLVRVGGLQSCRLWLRLRQRRHQSDGKRAQPVLNQNLLHEELLYLYVAKRLMLPTGQYAAKKRCSQEK